MRERITLDLHMPTLVSGYALALGRGSVSMATRDSGRAIDRLREHLDAEGAARLDSLSESFSLFVYEALQDKLTNVTARLLLHDGNLEDFPLNGLDAENRKRARLDQHRIARAFAAWAEAEGHLQVKTLRRRTRDTWTSIDGPSPYVINGAGLDAESLGLVAPQDLHFPQESADQDGGGPCGRQLRAHVVRPRDHQVSAAGLPQRCPRAVRGQGT